MANQIVWVDIPVTDLDRAVWFYSAVLGAAVTKQEYPGMTIALLPGYDTDVSGCLFRSDETRPSPPLPGGRPRSCRRPRRCLRRSRTAYG